jgi:hypothetical protein
MEKEEEEELLLTHEGQLVNSIEGLLRGCDLAKTLSRGKNPLLIQVTKGLEIACNQALKELESAPKRTTLEEWNEYLKPMGLIVRHQGRVK